MLRSTWVLALLAALVLPLPSARALEPLPPGPPVGLQAIPTEGGIQLTWEDPEDDGGAPVQAYRVYRDGKEIADGLAPSARGFLDDGGHELSAYLVSAVNDAGEGPPSSATAFSTCLTFYIGRLPPFAINITACLGASAWLEP